MIRKPVIAITVLGALLLAPPAGSQPPAAKAPGPPRLVAIAETKLLMEGLNQPNFQGIEKILKNKQADAESWTFARGQALLIAETGNLLMLRPPRNTGQDVWMKSASDMREAASQLARTLATRDEPRSQAGLISLANTCNSCHQSFRVATRIRAFDDTTPPMK